MIHPAQKRAFASLCALFDAPIIQNNLRGLYVEHLVCELLGQDWTVSGADWSAWDIEHLDGTKLEVKQSAAAQTWHEGQQAAPSPRFGIRVPSSPWDGKKYIEGGRRLADVYVFAWHPLRADSCDQRDPEQWQYFAVRSDSLPQQKSISLKGIRTLSDPLSSDELAGAVEQIRRRKILQ